MHYIASFLRYVLFDRRANVIFRWISVFKILPLAYKTFYLNGFTNSKFISSVAHTNMHLRFTLPSPVLTALPCLQPTGACRTRGLCLETLWTVDILLVLVTNVSFSTSLSFCIWPLQSSFQRVKIKYPSKLHLWAARGGAVVEALRCKPEGRAIDSRWYHWNFSLT
jgi:hypothetical protein